MSQEMDDNHIDYEADEELTGVQSYLNEVSRHDLLPVDETIRLAKLVQKNGDKAAIEKLITANLRLVITIAMDYRKYWMEDFLDLVQEGNVGLAKAVRKFDPERKIKFSYYASFWIKAYIMKYTMENKRLIKIGTTQTQRKLFFSLHKEIRKYEVSGIKPEPAEIAKNLQVNESEVVEMKQRLNGSEVSMHTPLTLGEPRCLGDMLPAGGPSVEEIAIEAEEKALVGNIIGAYKSLFNDKEMAIIDQRLLGAEAMTLKYIADQFDVSKERIRQIESGLIDKLQDIFKSEIPDRVAA